MPHCRLYLCILLTVSQFSLQAQKILINFKPETGYVYQTEHTSSIDFIQEFMGISYTTSTRLSRTMDNEVVSFTKDEGYQIKSSYVKIDFSMKAHMLDLDMSSLSQDTTNPMNVTMRSIIGQQYTQRLSSKAEILAINGLDELINRQINKLQLPEEEKKEFDTNFHDSFGEKALKEHFSQCIIYYPEDSVREGEEWFRSLIISPYGIPMHLLVNVRLISIAGNTAVFMSEGTLAARRRDISSNVTDTSYDLAGTYVSEVRINLKNGLITNSIITQFIQGKVNTADPNEPGKFIELPIKINSRSTSSTK